MSERKLGLSTRMALLVGGNLCLLLLALGSASPLLLLACAATYSILLLIWPQGSVSVLAVPCLMQFASVATKPAQSGLLQQRVNDLSSFGQEIEVGVWFGLAGVIALAIGLRLGSGGIENRMKFGMSNIASRWPAKATLVFALGSIAVGHVLQAMQYSVGPLREPFNQASNIVFAGLFILVCWSLATRKAQMLVALVVGVELGMGLMSFFSEFKFTILAIGAAFLFAVKRLTLRLVVLGGTVMVIAVAISVFWSAVKPDYRTMLNEGTGAQVVNVDAGERIGFLFDRAVNFSEQDYDEGVEALFNRLSYVDFLALTTQTVPSTIPHELGGRTGGAFAHVLIPRLIYPDKPALEHDTDVTTRYTGIEFGSRDLTSVSIGYLGELYVDFGYFGALVAVLLLGLIIGIMFKIIVRDPRAPPMINLALAFMVTMPIMFFERPLVKTLGPLILSFAIVLIIQRAVLPSIAKVKTIRPLWLIKPRKAALR